MKDSILYPEEELKKINAAIKQYTTVFKTTKDPFQKEKIRKKLIELKKYRERLMLMFYVHDESKRKNSENQAEERSFIEEIFTKLESPDYTDDELNKFYMYIEFFNTEFIAILSERKMKLDFKYGMDRDSFHHKFLTLKKHMDDYIQETDRIKEGNYRGDAELDIKVRNLKLRRNLFVETNRFFKEILLFTTDLLEDLRSLGLKCLNGDDIITFELIEEKRYFEGYTVHEALQSLEKFSSEIIAFLNIPDFEA
ncbi:MAG: hypothetical protein JW969_08465 [Spirochaetales bacterium]|nr:hypothetical protein [Spirochaetales bacterium]